MVCDCLWMIKGDQNLIYTLIPIFTAAVLPSPLAWIMYHLCCCVSAHTHIHTNTVALQYAGYYNSCTGFCEAGVITVIRVAVGGN